MMRNVYAFMKNTDQTEGRGPTIVDSLFTTMEDAKKIADALEPYGFPGQFNSVRKFEVYESCEDHPHWPSEANEKKKALAKLTEKERKLLGL